MPPLLLACLAYLGVALPGSTLGLLWPSMRLSLGEPVSALGILLVSGITASAISSAATGRLRVRTGPLVAAGTMLTALALAAESFAASLWVMAVGTALFGLGFGSLDTALNTHAARHFDARNINWMHASYGLGATAGPLLVTILLADGLGWRRVYGIMALVLAALACVLTLTRRHWQPPARPAAAAQAAARQAVVPQAAARQAVVPQAAARQAVVPQAAARQAAARPAAGRRPRAAAYLGALTFAAVETGIESAAGIWGYLFLTAGRGLPNEAAGVAVSAYWAMMFAGRVILGPVAERLGPARVLTAAVAGVALGAALMTVPGPGLLAVAGLMTLGLAAAPVFPLLTLTTGQRAGTSQLVSLQVAASAVGGAALPAGLGLATGAVGAWILAPALLVLGLAMGGLFAFLSRSRQPGAGRAELRRREFFLPNGHVPAAITTLPSRECHVEGPEFKLWKEVIEASLQASVNAQNHLLTMNETSSGRKKPAAGKVPRQNARQNVLPKPALPNAAMTPQTPQAAPSSR